MIGDRQLLSQMLFNLVENAGNHTPPGTRILVSLQRLDDHAVLCVADDGEGVPESDRERILRRFVRLEKSRHTSGHGLGLNLVAAIAAAHGARLTFGDAAPGLVVLLRFPCG